MKKMYEVKTVYPNGYHTHRYIVGKKKAKAIFDEEVDNFFDEDSCGPEVYVGFYPGRVELHRVIDMEDGELFPVEKILVKEMEKPE